MNPDELKQIIKEAMAEERRDFWVDPERHYLDHKTIRRLKCLNDKTSEEYLEDHRWVQSVRKTLGTSQSVILRTGLGLVVVGGLVWLGDAVWHFLITTMRTTKL